MGDVDIDLICAVLLGAEDAPGTEKLYLVDSDGVAFPVVSLGDLRALIAELRDLRAYKAKLVAMADKAEKELDAEDDRIVELTAERDQARAEVQRLREYKAVIDAAVAAASKHVGCGDNSCMFEKPKGMATNGGCRCISRDRHRPFVPSALALLYGAAKAGDSGEHRSGG